MDFEYELFEDRVLMIVGYMGNDKNIIVPSEIDGKPTEAIAEGAFSDIREIESITVPECVKYIGDYAFGWFYDTQSGELIKNDDMLFFCSPGTECVEYLRENGFDEKNIIAVDTKDIVIPEGIKKYAVKYFGREAFRHIDRLGLLHIPYTAACVPSFEFSRNTCIKSIIIPAGVNTICYKAFGGNSELTSVKLSKGLKIVEDSAFDVCKKLESIDIPETVNAIGCRAFRDCTSLHTVNIAEGVICIDDYAFNGCTSLKSVTIPASVIYIGEYAFGWTNDWNDTKKATRHEDFIIYCYPDTAGERYAKKNGFEYELIVPPHEDPPKADEEPADTSNEASKPDEPETLTICNGMVVEKEEMYIPEEINGMTVTAIGEGAFFEYKTLETVAIPKSVTAIEGYAFSICLNLRNVTISDNVEKIGEGAFSCCVKLRRIILPKNLKTIGAKAFKGCIKLARVDIPEGVTDIGEQAFFKCSKLVSLTIPKSVIHIGENAIGMTVDAEKNIVHEDRGSIVVYCYAGTEGERYAEENGLQYEIIDENEFHSETEIVLERTDVKNEDEIIIPNRLGGKSVRIIGRKALFNYKARRMIIPEGVVYLRPSAFYKCRRLTDIELPKSLKRIGNSVFECCDSLKTVSIPEGITTIENYAFDSCCSLSSIAFPDSVTHIGNGAFSYCFSLSKLTLPKSLETIEVRAFLECESLTELTIPDGVRHIGKDAFWGCLSLKKLTLPKGLKDFGDSAFQGCKSLTEVVIPEGIETIGESAFLGCKSLTKVNFPDSVTNIEQDAFLGCINLKNVTLPKGLKALESDVFSRCKSLAEINIPESVERIKVYAFLDCESLKSITIPSNVKVIGHGAFKGCKELSEAIISEGVQRIEDDAFFDCNKLMSVTIPKSVISITGAPFGFQVGEEGKGSSKNESFKIYCYSGSAGEAYAQDYEFDYELLDPPEEAIPEQEVCEQAPRRSLFGALINKLALLRKKALAKRSGKDNKPVTKAPHWGMWKSLINKKYPALAQCLNEGASSEEIDDIERKLGVSLPEQLKDIYKENNGEKADSLLGIIGGFRLYTLDEIYSSWYDWKKMYDEMDEEALEEMSMFSASEPEDCIKKQYIDLRWIPLCDDGSGNHIGIDLDPDTEGKAGQVINFGTDEDEKIVIANDIDAFFKRLCRIFGGKGLHLTEEGLKPSGHEHFIDYLRSDGAIK